MTARQTLCCALLGQYREEMRRDYVTGVYNRAFLDSTYRKKVAAAACAGKPVSVVAARVNEYWNLLREEGTHAADCCLNTAAGILQLAARAGPAERCCPPGRRHFPGGERWHPGGKTAGCAA